MNWEALGAIGEIVGAIAVIATLGYLAVQIRQNTQSVRSSTTQNTTATAIHVLLGVLQTPGSADILARGRQGLASLTEAERIAFARMYFSVFRSSENLFYQYKQGLLDTEMWDGYECTSSGEVLSTQVFASGGATGRTGSVRRSRTMSARSSRVGMMGRSVALMKAELQGIGMSR